MATVVIMIMIMTIIITTPSVFRSIHEHYTVYTTINFDLPLWRRHFFSADGWRTGAKFSLFYCSGTAIEQGNRFPGNKQKRTRFSPSQRYELEMAFNQFQYLTPHFKHKLQELGISKDKIKVTLHWFLRAAKKLIIFTVSVLVLQQLSENNQA